MTKTDKIRKLLADGVAVPVIAKRVKVSPSYIYSLRAKKKAKRKAATPKQEDVPVLVGLPNPLSIQIGGDHYKHMKIQPVEFIVANEIGFLEGCVIKRVCRWRMKDGIADLEKARHEIDLLINAQQ